MRHSMENALLQEERSLPMKSTAITSGLSRQAEQMPTQILLSSARLFIDLFMPLMKKLFPVCSKPCHWILNSEKSSINCENKQI